MTTEVTGGGATITAPAVVMHEREPDPSWVKRLREIAPISETHSWLALRWFAEAERWVVYEMIPNAHIDVGFRSELEGAHPDGLEDWARICSAYQWKMYRKHRVHARPCWVIQGENGGNKIQFDEADKELCRAVGLPTEPPAPGSMPYAPFDERAVRQLLAMNKLVKAKNDLGEFKKRFGTVEGHKREYAANLRSAREQYVKHLNEQFAEPAEFFIKAERNGELSNHKKTDDDWAELDEKADENYLTSGRF